MKIFVTGGSGYIGEEVALGLRRAGHQVFALVRSEEKAKNLVKNEVVPVIGDLVKPETYKQIVENCEVVVHTAQDIKKYEETDRAAVLHLSGALASKGNPKSKIFLFTSGILVYPDSPNKLLDENDPVGPAVAFTGPRTDLEQQVLALKTVAGVVVRPSFVFGKNTGHFIHYFAQAKQGKVVVSGNPEVGWSEVHIDDLVDGYRRIVESAPSVVDGQIFNFADDSRNSNLTIATAYARVAGYTGQISTTETPYPVFNRTVFVDYRKANRILGWVPNHRPLLDEVQLYFDSWKAKQTN